MTTTTLSLFKRFSAHLACVLVLGLTAACSPKQLEDLVENTVGGNVSGLNGTLVIRNNNNDELTITSNGDFVFSETLGITNRYQVLVVQNPSGQICSVENASGVMSVVNIKDVIIVCSSTAHTISGTVTGLTGTLEIDNNLSDPLTITADGVFTFNTPVAHGAAYSVTVIAQPAGQTCTLSMASGTATASVTDVTITCAP